MSSSDQWSWGKKKKKKVRGIRLVCGWEFNRVERWGGGRVVVRERKIFFIFLDICFFLIQIIFFQKIMYSFVYYR